MSAVEYHELSMGHPRKVVSKGGLVVTVIDRPNLSVALAPDELRTAVQ